MNLDRLENLTRDHRIANVNDDLVAIAAMSAAIVSEAKQLICDKHVKRTTKRIIKLNRAIKNLKGMAPGARCHVKPFKGLVLSGKCHVVLETLEMLLVNAEMQI